MGPHELFATRHREWFKAVFKGRVLRPNRIDPYQSSARSATAFFRRMLQVEAGEEVPSQVVSDTRDAELIESVDGVVSLTRFGHRVLADWRRLGIREPDSDYELALATSMLRAGLDDEVPLFHTLYGRWLRLVDLQPASYWLASKWRLTLPEYLNQERFGFNPFAVIAATNFGVVGDEEEWVDWAGQDPAMAAPIQVLREKVDNRKGRLEFCQAMELIRLSENHAELLPETIASWSPK